MKKQKIHTIITFLIALVWIANGAFCKILAMVPRHEEIVGKILRLDRPSAAFATFGIGLLELLMAIWILSKIAPRINAITQIIIISTMNILEFILVPNILLWGRFNSVFALLFILLIYYNEFHLNKKTTPQT